MGIAAKIIKRFWPVLVIIGVWLVFASPYLFANKVPFPSTYQVTFFPPWSAAYGMPVKNNAMPDVITQIYPWKTLTIETWKAGEVPLWNPYSFAGTPHAANYQTAVFSPMNLLFFVLPQVDAWTLMIILQPLLAGLFMYLFVGTLVKDSFGRLLSAIGFMFCGFLVVWMAYGTLGYAALALPLILWGIRTYAKDKSYPAGLAIALGVAVSFLSGHFQISLYVLVASVAFAAFEKSLVSVFYILVGLLLASPQLLLSYDAYQRSVRSEIFRAGEIIPWQYLTTLLAPDFYGNPVTRNDWFGHYAEWAGYVGVVPFLLGLWAVVFVRKREVWFFTAVAVAALLLATPTPISQLLYALKIPVLGTSAASRVIILFSFALSVLAAYGLEALRASWAKGKLKPTAIFAGAVVLVVAAIWGALIFGNWLPGDKLIVARRNFLLPTGLTAVSLLLMLGGYVVKKKLLLLVICIVLVAIAAGDSLRFTMKWMPADPKELVFPPMQIIDALKNTVGISRVMGNYGGELAVPSRVQSLEGYDALYQGRYGEFIASANTGTITTPTRSVVDVDVAGVHVEKLLALTGTGFVLHRKSDGRFPWAYPVWNYPYYEKLYEDDYYELHRNGNAMPRAFLVSSYIASGDPALLIKSLWSDGVSLRNTVILETDPNVTLAASAGTATIEKYTPTSLTIKTISEGAKLLFLSDVYDPGWQATVDGDPVDIFRADYAFRAVPVPPGEHIITMRYAPRGWAWGKYLSIMAVGILIGAGLKKRYEHRHL
jgi:hypothetical protein